MKIGEDVFRVMVFMDSSGGKELEGVLVKKRKGYKEIVAGDGYRVVRVKEKADKKERVFDCWLSRRTLESIKEAEEIFLVQENLNI